MAKYEVKHDCGHTATHQLYGKHSERERRLEWLAGVDCTDCYKAAQEKEKAQANAAAAEANAKRGAAELKGSEKQVAWAESIRHQFLTAVEGPVREECYEDKRLLIDQMAAEYRSITEAGWWIDRRQKLTYDDRGGALLEEAVKMRSQLPEAAKTAIPELDKLLEVE